MKMRVIVIEHSFRVVKGHSFERKMLEMERMRTRSILLMIYYVYLGTFFSTIKGQSCRKG